MDVGNIRIRIGVLMICILLLASFSFGGASRADVFVQFFVRIVAIVVISICLWVPAGCQRNSSRTPLLLLFCLAIVIGFQLVPVPPEIWRSLPGRGPYLDALQTMQSSSAWRTISLTPDLTFNSLLAILPPLSAILAMRAIDRQYRAILVPAILIGVAISCVLGLIQVTTGKLYFYDITNRGSAVGVFANRNHQAVLLAAALPLLACWSALSHQDRKYRQLRTWLSLCMAAAICPLLLITGSRAGLVLGLLGAAGAVLIAGRSRSNTEDDGRRSMATLALLPLLIGLVAVVGAVVLARDEALRRLVETESSELRTELLPTFLQMSRDFFPIGSGFGSFDPAYRSYESYDKLSIAYLNHAHNDLAQLAIEGGLLGLAIVGIFVVWFMVRSWRWWIQRPDNSSVLLGQAGSAVATLLLLSSLVDYPLRTPLLAVVMAIAIIWVFAEPARRDA